MLLSALPAFTYPALYQLYDLFPQQDVLWIDLTVVVVVSEQPAAELQPAVDQLQKIRERIRLVVPVHPLGNAGGGAVGEHIVRFPARPFQCVQRGGVLLARGKLLRPPGLADDPEPAPTSENQAGVLHPEVRGIRIEDAVLHIVGGGPTHGEEGAPLNVIELPPHQVQDVGPDALNLSTMPVLHRKLPEHPVVLVVPGDEQGGEGLLVQPVQLFPLLCGAVPQPAKVAQNNHVVVPVHLPLLGEMLPLLGEMLPREPLEASVAIARRKNHVYEPPSIV